MKTSPSHARSELGTRTLDSRAFGSYAFTLSVGALLLTACAKGQTQNQQRDLAPSVASGWSRDKRELGGAIRVDSKHRRSRGELERSR